MQTFVRKARSQAAACGSCFGRYRPDADTGWRASTVYWVIFFKRGGPETADLNDLSLSLVLTIQELLGYPISIRQMLVWLMGISDLVGVTV